MDNSIIQQRYQSQSKDRSPYGRAVNYGSNDAYRGDALRNSAYQQPKDQNTIDEEELYNRRRDEEIRRHVQARESSNEMQSSHYSNKHKPSERIRSRLDQSQNGQNQNGQINSQPYETFGNSLPSRDKSPYSNNGVIAKDEGIPSYVKEHIANIQSDNQSLMRRLGLVEQELDRVHREKNELYERSAIISQESTELQKLINLEDNVDKVNRHINDDINYEKDRGMGLRQRLKDSELIKHDIIIKLRKIEHKQDNFASQNQAQQSELQMKLSHISDIEKEHYYTQEKIKQVNNYIDKLRLEAHQENREKSEIQAELNLVHAERDDLLNKLDHLTSKYDECVQEITHDREDMEISNNRHEKLVAAKIIFQELETVSRNKVRSGIDDIKNYCDFDRKCHGKLQLLANVMLKIGKYQLKNAMTQWFSNSLKPINIKLQSLALSDNMYTNKLKQRMFYMWFKKYDKRINSYEDKTTAVKQIWLIHQRDTQIELKRSFTIWRDILKRGSLKRMKVKKLIWRLYFNKLSTAMCIWQQYSSRVDNQVRLNLLAQQFSQKQYMTLLFNNFKHETIDRKRKRHNIAFHVIKAWQDYIRHRKFLMGASLNAIHYKKQHNVSLIKACYDAIRQYKEQSKHDKINEELTQDVLPEIESLNQEISERSVNKNFKNKEKACKSVKVMLSKQLYTYFNQWKQANESYQYKLRTTVKDKIIKVYIDQLRKAFVLWHTNSDGNQINSQQCIVEDLQGDQSNLTEEVVALQKEVKDKTQQLDQSQNRKLNKSLISYQKRMKQIAIGRWKDNIEIQNVKENGSEFILKKIRARLLRSAFDLYKSGSDYKKKLDTEEERYKYLINTRNERLKRRVYNSWHLYRTNFIKAKTYWNRIYIKMDLVMKNLAMRRWKEESQLILESSLENSQNEVINHIEIKNAELGQLHTQEQSIQQQNNNIKSRMTKQAQRVLANTIAKYYYIGHTRGFEKWKEFTTFEQRRERLMKKMINHWRMYQFQNVKTTFQRWMVNSDIELKQQSLKKEEHRLEDLNFQHQQQQQQFKGENQHIDEELLQIQGQQKMYNFRLQKSVQLIVGKVDGNYYLSQKRYILTQWRDYVKREKHFILCIKNVIQKSMWQRGFNEIRGTARGVTHEDKLLQVLNRFRIKFWKRTCSNAFSQWKTGVYKTIMSHIEDVTEETNLYVEDHQDKVIVRKQENAVKSAKIVKQNHTANIFNNWKYITKQIKLLRLKNLKYNDNAEVQNKKIAIIKWNRRVKATKLARNRMLRLKNKFQKIRKMLVFNGMKKIFFAAKDFMSRISNLANIHDQQALKIGYNSIQSYVRAKNYVYGKKKEHASKDFVSLLNNLLSRRMGTYLRDLKYKTSVEYKQNLHKAFTVFQKLNGRLRSYFLRWKQENEFRKLAQELNEEGPIRELWFEERQLLENCKKFMKDEGYSQRDIEQALKSGNLEKKTQILKSIRRMQHYNVDLNCKPNMFDRWRQYVHIRKLFKYWLQFVDRRSSHVQSDLARSFDRWKNYESSQKRDLVKMPKKQLDQKIINNSNRLDNLAENINNKENMLQHLDAQRETLVDNYIKGQKLALGLLLNNNKRSLHKAFLKWSRTADNTKSDTLETRLRKQVETIAALKEKLREVEIDNESLANENEELRQFSLDGYEIAKNVQVLSLEREKLSVDLADKSQIIRKLLDENEVLTNCLHQAQSEAQKLIKSTNSKYY